jgi:iron-sulfur cluster assembly accessory protein
LAKRFACSDRHHFIHALLSRFGERTQRLLFLRFPVSSFWFLPYDFLPMMTITAAAAAELQSLLAAKGLGEGSGLRIGISRGGCAGLQYDMELGGGEPGDEISERGAMRVFVAADAAKLLGGATLDYVDDLAGAGFRIVNPNAARSCGCGTSFEPAEVAATH